MTLHELTARVAYRLYVLRGRSPGRQWEDWLSAEAIVSWCLAYAGVGGPDPRQTEAACAARPSAASPEESTGESPEEQALAALRAAVAARGRREVSRRLGYKSTSTVGRCLRGQRRIDPELAARILAALGARSEGGSEEGQRQAA
ncbi:MAG: DUF2934 domain-containing protein [Planctomycetota bacterium]|nr:MAG: DUF2934 domain-containing protein [Planctomycetota bacterium]